MVDDVKVERSEGVSLGSDGAGLVLAGVVRAALDDLEPVPGGAFHHELISGGGLVDGFAVLQPLKLEWWLWKEYCISDCFTEVCIKLKLSSDRPTMSILLYYRELQN